MLGNAIKFLKLGGFRVEFGEYWPIDVPERLECDQIYVMDTSMDSTPDLDPKTACALEAAARQHPQKLVYFMTRRDRLRIDDTLKSLADLENIRFAQMDPNDVLEGTGVPSGEDPWAGMLSQEQTASDKSSSSARSLLKRHTDTLKYAILWKHGGLAIDSDVVVLENLDWLFNRNAIGLKRLNWRQAPESAGSHLLSFQLGHPFLKQCLRTLSKIREDRLFNARTDVSGNYLVSLVLQNACEPQENDAYRCRLVDTLMPNEDRMVPHINRAIRLIPPGNLYAEGPTFAFRDVYLGIWERLTQLLTGITAEHKDLATSKISESNKPPVMLKWQWPSSGFRAVRTVTRNGAAEIARNHCPGMAKHF